MSLLLFQVGISGPLLLALILYTAARREQGGLVHRYLLFLLVMMLSWMVGMVVDAADAPQTKLLAKLLLYPPAAFMAPGFCLMMLLYARVELFELRRSARAAVLAPFLFFLLAFATDSWHGLMADPMAVLESDTDLGAPGPLFWSFQVFSNASALVGLGVAGWIARTSPLREERRRMALLCVGAFLPLIVHAAYTFQLLPLDAPLTPGSLGVTALMIVASIQRYRLLEVQPVARRDVIEASSDAVIVADGDEHVVDLNPTAAALLGGPRSALLGRKLAAAFEALGPTEPSGVVEGLLQTLRAGDTPPVTELETADGHVLEVSVGCPRGASGGTAGYFVVLRDRTKERRAEQLLQRSQRLESVGILAAGVAHEVNNPLAFVRSNLAHLCQIASSLESRSDELPKDLSEQTQDLSDVMEETVAGLDRIQKTVQGLLYLSRKAREGFEVCDANEIIVAAARFASLEGDASVRLESHLEEDLPSIEASPDQLVQVLLNLFLNARHSLRGRTDATIVASTRAHGEWVEIRVADNGSGVPESIRDRIFDPFFTTRAPNEGTGLGLPIAFDIVSEHGGILELETPPAGGACFVVRLPARAR